MTGPEDGNSGSSRKQESPDYQTQLMLDEQQNKKGLQIARQKQDDEDLDNQGNARPLSRPNKNPFSPGMPPSANRTGNPSAKSADSSEKVAGEQTAWDKGGSHFTNKRYSEYFDPCQDAANRSLKCMRRNGGDRGMCQDYFEAYRECKKSWMEEMKEQKRREGRGWFG